MSDDTRITSNPQSKDTRITADMPSEADTQRGKMSWRLGCSLAVLIFLLIAGFIWWSEGAPERKINRMLAEDGPKAGATREEVEAWLDQKSIRHERIESLEDTGGYPAGEPPLRFGNLVPGIQNEFVVGIVHAHQHKNWSGGQVWIYFFFDSDDHLVQHVIKRWHGWL